MSPLTCHNWFLVSKVDASDQDKFGVTADVVAVTRQGMQQRDMTASVTSEI
jgi:hypothetical protein